jgi:hypothetical protein
VTGAAEFAGAILSRVIQLNELDLTRSAALVPVDSALATVLHERADWELVYSDGVTVMFLKSKTRNRAAQSREGNPAHRDVEISFLNTSRAWRIGSQGRHLSQRRVLDFSRSCRAGNFRKAGIGAKRVPRMAQVICLQNPADGATSLRSVGCYLYDSLGDAASRGKVIQVGPAMNVFRLSSIISSSRARSTAHHLSGLSKQRT